jgi:hypothetical protein
MCGRVESRHIEPGLDRFDRDDDDCAAAPTDGPLLRHEGAG